MVKATKCGTCGEKFQGTNDIIDRLEMKHLTTTGHRHFKGVLGQGDHTLRLPGEPQYEVRAQALKAQESAKLPKVIKVEETDVGLRLENHSDRLWRLEHETLPKLVARMDKLERVESLYDDLVALLLRHAPQIAPVAVQSVPVAPTPAPPAEAPTIRRLDRVGLFPPSMVDRFPKKPPTQEDIELARKHLRKGVNLGDIQQGALWRTMDWSEETTQFRAAAAVEKLYVDGEVQTVQDGRKTKLVLKKDVKT